MVGLAVRRPLRSDGTASSPLISGTCQQPNSKPAAANVRLAATAMLIPHWGGGARASPGVCLMLAGGFHEGWTVTSVLILPLVALLVISLLGVSVAIARPGVSRPDIDTVQVIFRWRHTEHEMAPLSITASAQQFLLGIFTLPMVKFLSPGSLSPHTSTYRSRLLPLTHWRPTSSRWHDPSLARAHSVARIKRATTSSTTSRLGG